MNYPDQDPERIKYFKKYFKSPEWRKIKDEMLKDFDILEKIIEYCNNEPFATGYFSPGGVFHFSQILPNTPEKAAGENEGIYSKKDEEIPCEIGEKGAYKYPREWDNFENLIIEIGYFEIVQMVSNEKLQHELKKALDQGQNLPCQDVEQWKKLTPEEREEIILEEKGFFEKCPSIKVLNLLEKIKKQCNKNEADFWRRNEQIFIDCFKAGRAYEQTIIKPFEPSAKKELTKEKRKNDGQKDRSLKAKERRALIYENIEAIIKREKCKQTEAFGIYYNEHNADFEKKYKENKVKGWKNTCKIRAIYSIKKDYNTHKKENN